MSRRKPAEGCVICERTLKEIGGARLVATHEHGIRICTPEICMGSIRHPARTIRLPGDFHDVIIALSGEGLWTDEVVDRVRATCMSGLRPWFCQRCAKHHLCPGCGTPLTKVPTSDFLEDDGRTNHAPSFSGYLQRCPNPDCPSSQTGEENGKS